MKSGEPAHNKGVYTSVPFKDGTFKICTGCKELKEVTLLNFPAREKGCTRSCAECRACRNIRSKIIRENNLERSKACSRESATRWYKNNKERAKETRKRYASNPEYKKIRNEKLRIKRTTDPCAIVRMRVGTQIRMAVRLGKGGQTTFGLLGYTRDELVSHLERQFTAGMNWEVFATGRIHIDHIIPLSSFDFSGEDKDDQIRKAWAMPNLRPLWRSENILKAAKRIHLL